MKVYLVRHSFAWLIRNNRNTKNFLAPIQKRKSLGLSILRLFAWLIPIIVLTASLAGITILTLGGHFVIITA